MHGSDVLYYINMVVMIISVGVLCYSTYKIYKINKEPEEVAPVVEIPPSSGLEMLEYSNKVIEFIQEIVKHIVVLRFKEFVNKYNVENVNRSIINKLIEEIANEVNSAIDVHKIKFSETVFTEKFYMTYMIDLVSNMVTSLLEKELSES